MLEFKATPVDTIQLAMVIIDHPVPKGYAASPRLIEQPLKGGASYPTDIFRCIAHF